MPISQMKKPGPLLGVDAQIRAQIKPHTCWPFSRVLPSALHRAGTGRWASPGLAFGVRFEASSRYVLSPDPAGAAILLRAAVGSPCGSGQRGTEEGAGGRSGDVHSGPSCSFGRKSTGLGVEDALGGGMTGSAGGAPGLGPSLLLWPRAHYVSSWGLWLQARGLGLETSVLRGSRQDWRAWWVPKDWWQGHCYVTLRPLGA